MSPLTPIVLLLAAAPAEWPSWSLGPGSNPVCWDSGRSVAFLADDGEGLSLVTCRWDGSSATAALGPRSRTATPALLPDDAIPPIRVSADGRHAIVGSRLLVGLDGEGATELPPLAALAPGSRLRDAALSGDGSVVAVVAPDGRVLVARAPRGTFTQVPARAAAERVALDTVGLRVVVSGDAWSQCIALEEGSVLCEVPSALAALSGDGKRLAYVIGGTVHRLDLATARETTLPVPGDAAGDVSAIASAERGSRFLIRSGTRLLAFGWVRSEVHEVASCDLGARFCLSADGNAVAYESGGQVRVAAFGLDAPVEAVAASVPPRPRGVAFGTTLEGLSNLADQIAASHGGGAEPPTGTTATDQATGWSLFRMDAPPCSFMVPPGWSARTDDGGASVAPPSGNPRAIIRVRRPCSDSAGSLVRARAEELGLQGEVGSGLLSGVPAAAIRGSLPDGSSLWIIAARWADGAVIVEVHALGSIAPDAVRIVESIVLDPWPDKPEPPVRQEHPATP